MRIVSKQRAWLALMEAGFTNARKHNTAVGKWGAAIAAIERNASRRGSVQRVAS